MNISDIVSEDFAECSPETPVSKLSGTFADPSVKGVVVHGDEFEGVITRKQLASSHHPPGETVRSLVWHVPRLSPDEDVRAVAQLMIDSDSRVLPVFEGQELTGVVTVDGILQAVKPFLDAVTVEDVCTRELITITPDSSLGKALNVFRENRITHLPVVEDATAVGILSLYDLVDVTIRGERQSQGGEPSGTDPFGGQISDSAGRTRRGGYGAREGERLRMLDVPVRDLMITPARTIDPGETLDTAVEEMFSIDGSSLVVTRDGTPFGIVTKTDILDSLTWEVSGNRAVQLYGVDLLDNMTYEDIVSMVETFERKAGDTTILDAKVHLHKHDEKHRGTPLLLARIRLHTDRGLYIATGEGYGASHALNEARDALQRQIRDDKTYDRSKKPPSAEFWEKRFGWILEE